MWPFKPKPKLAKRSPSITIGDIAANWSADSGWEFVDPILQVDCMLNETDNFDEAVVAKLPMVRAWIVQLGDEITNAVNDYAKRSELPANVQEIQRIDMSALLASNSIDICYTADEWADFAINVVVTDGQIESLYAGD